MRGVLTGMRYAHFRAAAEYVAAAFAGIPTVSRVALFGSVSSSPRMEPGRARTRRGHIHEREQRHPEDALEVYKRQIERTVARTSDEAYRDAIGLLRRVNALLVQVERKSEFAEHLESVRARFKMKRNFIKLIDRAKWS